jgi:hypothetical protein
MHSSPRLLFLVLAGLWAAAGTVRAAEPAEEKPAEQVRAAVRKGVEFLRQQEQGRGSWEASGGGAAQIVPGGVTSLVLLALLESGVKPDEPAVTRGLDYVRRLQSDMTYVVSLQTMVLCRADPKKDRELIQAKVDLLLAGRQRDGRALLGWSYGLHALTKNTDNSNTEYAVLALHAARRAGARIDEEVWKEVRAYYLDRQNPDGGWPYRLQRGEPSTRTMACAGVCGLLITGQALGLHGDAPLRPVARGLEVVTPHFDPDREPHVYDLLRALGAIPVLAGKDVPAEQDRELRDCVRRGVEFLLKKQQTDGAWPGGALAEAGPVSTSLALLSLAQAR